MNCFLRDDAGLIALLVKDVPALFLKNSGNQPQPPRIHADFRCSETRGQKRKIRRPKGWRGSEATSWLEPEQAFALIRDAYAIEPEFGALCLTLLYTGMRLSDPLRARMRELKLNRSLLYVPDTKNGEPRPARLPPAVVKAALRELPPRIKRPRKAAGKALKDVEAGRSLASAGAPWLERPAEEKLFRFHAGGRLRNLFALALARAGLSFPRWQCGFHLFCRADPAQKHEPGERISRK